MYTYSLSSAGISHATKDITFSLGESRVMQCKLRENAICATTTRLPSREIYKRCRVCWKSSIQVENCVSQSPSRASCCWTCWTSREPINIAEKQLISTCSNIDLIYFYTRLDVTLRKYYELTDFKKIKSVVTYNKIQNNEKLEATITEHFAHLHGVLQNTEAKLMKQLHEQRDYLKNNLDDIKVQLQTQEEKLKLTLQIASHAKEIYHKVDIRNAINILKEMTDLPCHLMYKDMSQTYEPEFTADHSIVATIEDHCTIKIPSMSSYSLVRRDELPKNYILSPLPKKRLSILEKPSSRVLAIQPNNSLSATSIKTEDKAQKSISDCKVEVSYVVNPSFFFVRKVATKAEFLQLEEDLTTYGNNEQNLEMPINIKHGDICLVKHKATTEWYRGRVKAVYTENENGETLYNVIYIDYGYEDCNVVTSRVREIPEHLNVLPPQAIRCSLHGLIPKSAHWTSASTNTFLKLTNGADCRMSVIESTPDILYIDLCIIPRNNMGPQSMYSIMKVMDYARLDVEHSSMEVSESTYVYSKEELTLNKSTFVTISWVVSPGEIYVSKIVRKNRFLKMIEELNEYYKTEASVKMIDVPQKGLPCAAQFEDNTWQRGEIMKIIDEDKVKVFFVDWGCISIQDRDAIREIPSRYTLFKAQAIRIALMYIWPEANGKWKPAAMRSLQVLINEAENITVNPRRRTENGYIGCMYCDNMDVSRQLKNEGVVNEFHVTNKFKKLHKKSRSPVKYIPALLEKTDSTVQDFCDLDDTVNNKSVKDETIKDPFKVEVRIQRVVTPDCIYVAQMEHEKSNAKMISAMQKFYDSYLSEPRNKWNEGALCAVYSPKDKSYFRAKILKIQSPAEVLVYFYDMGIEETVTLKNIQVLHSKFAKEATYCFKVKLAGILPCGGSSMWPSLSCTTLSEIIRDNANCKFYITKPIQENICDGAIPVELWVRQAKIPGPLAPTKIEINSINRMLVDKGVALPIKNYFAKADSILAAEFKRLLEENPLFVSTEEEEVKWLNKVLNADSEIDETLISHNDLSNCDISTDVLTDLSQNAKTYDSTNRECSVKFSNWLPPIEITEEVFLAVPTYVDNKCIVYLHSKKYNADLLNYIESELQIHYKNIKINKEKQWKEGDLCIARYHHNKKWYRGRVVQNLGNILQVEFIDYGNMEECEIQDVSDHVRLGHIPIQCTKCVISGLKPASANGKWMLHDLDRIHALLVDQECKVSILQRQLTHLIVSITLLKPWKCDLLLYLANHMDMSIEIKRKDWNDSENSDNDEDLISNFTRDVVIEEIVSDYEKCITDTSDKSLETYTQSFMFDNNLISGNLAKSSNAKFEQAESKQTSDSESVSSIDMITVNKHLICSTPQTQSSEEEEECFTSYKRLIIPQETKYIELILCCNKDPITSFARIAENNDDMFSNIFHEYYLQYEAIMSNLQTDACHQPLIATFAKNTPCVAKFIDDMWYRCIITSNKKIPNSEYIKISLYYIDFGNHEDRKLDLLSKNHDLHVPKEEWLELPAMAIKCTFWGLNFVSNDIGLLASKLNEIYNQAVVARVKEIVDGDSLSVEIYKDKTCEELFYAHLIKEGLYQFKKPKED
ncbi:hypothetical protein P5V15_013427 [Pogonomyrmex californicus]